PPYNSNPPACRQEMRHSQQHAWYGHAKAAVDECRLLCHQPTESEPDASGDQCDSYVAVRLSGFLRHFNAPSFGRII
ncbi:hypothetical protein, partial [Pseudomonas sp.]|uniref:hypothetical protein n=1 Tax=Pseudomonas sp. TaxID=306 RepID=UPI0027B990BA